MVELVRVLLPASFVALGVGLGLGLAGGCGTEGSACRSSADCSGELECLGPNTPQVCGIPPMEACASDAECGGGLVCHARPDSCSPDGVGSACDQPCVEGGCGEGFRCAGTGACEAIPCDEDYACPSHQSCDPSVAASGPVHARAHGCVAVSCGDDGDCEASQACVNGVCQDGAGTCVEAQAVP